MLKSTGLGRYTGPLFRFEIKQPMSQWVKYLQLRPPVARFGVVIKGLCQCVEFDQVV